MLTGLDCKGQRGANSSFFHDQVKKAESLYRELGCKFPDLDGEQEAFLEAVKKWKGLLGLLKCAALE
jgi:hypothetical protein